MWAIIEENRVLEVTNTNPNGRFHPSVSWVSVPDGTQPGMVKVGSSYEWPSPETQQIKVITRRKGRLALLQVGKLDLVESDINAIEDATERRAAQIEYEADTWELDNPFLKSRWAAMGGTEQELKDLFNFANTL